LLDTHTLLWFVADRDECSPLALTAISDEVNEIYISTASLWEIAIKTTAGKLQLSMSLNDFIEEQFDENAFTLLPIRVGHVLRITELPLIHRDPFDRMLIAQGLVEGMPVISRDVQFDAYGVQRIW